MERLVIGSRGSELALAQANGIADRLRAAHPGLAVSIEIIKTTGDRVQDVPLAQVGGKGLFTKEIEVALLEGRIDLAVHSLKDLPVDLSAGLVLAAVPAREDPADVFIGTNGGGLDALPEGARIGTSSPRRAAQLKTHRPDLTLTDIRGNVPTRIEKLRRGEFDGIVLAAAGLRRLGLLTDAMHRLPPEVMIAAPGQGALGLETRDDRDVLTCVRALHDRGAEAEITAERTVLAALGGGCQVPLGANARLHDGTMTLRAVICDIESGDAIRAEATGPAAEAVALGNAVAEQLLSQGARALVGASPTGALAGTLRGKRIVVTRARAQAGALAERLEAAGADVIEFPTIEVVAKRPEAAIPPAEGYDGIVFTSANGVRYFAEALAAQGRSLADFREGLVCAVGPATAAAARDHGLPATLTPDAFVADALVPAMAATCGELSGRRFLLPRGNLGSSTLPDALAAAGAGVDKCIVYTTRPVKPAAETVAALADRPPDVLTFTSSSTAENFHAAFNDEQRNRLQARCRVAAIGPVSAATLESLGWRVDIQPDMHDIPHLVEAIARSVS